MEEKSNGIKTESSVETAKRLYKGFNTGDIESVLASMDDDVQWTEPEGHFISGTSHGPKAVLENVLEPIMKQFESFEVNPDRYIEAGDTVVALGTMQATTKSGEQKESPFAHVIDFHDGHIRKFENFTDTALWV